MQNCGMAFPFVTWAETLSTRKRQNLGEDLYFFFFFWSSANFGPKTGLILNGEILLFVFITFKFSAPPSFENPAYATEQNDGTDMEPFLNVTKMPGNT